MQGGLHRPRKKLCTLIRYDTEDLAVRGEAKCLCGRKLGTLSRIEDKDDSFVVERMAGRSGLGSCRVLTRSPEILVLEAVQRDRGRVLVSLILSVPLTPRR